MNFARTPLGSANRVSPGPNIITHERESLFTCTRLNFHQDVNNVIGEKLMLKITYTRLVACGFLFCSACVGMRQYVFSN